jgi:cell division protein FtsB
LFYTRWILVLLACAAASLLGELLLADDGYRKTLKLRAAVAEQRALNEELRERNAALDAEVVNLKRGRDAAEERARTDLGLVGPGETFYQVVTRDGAPRD